MSPKRTDIYLEVGTKGVFACAVDWPGWCRSGPDEESALRALLDCGPAYSAVLRSTRLGFTAPAGRGDLRVVERVEGTATTDFGAPGAIPSADRATVTSADLARIETVLRAGWRALDLARKRAAGKTLRKGPRGGGRELDAIMRHVIDADAGYLGALGWKAGSSGSVDERLEHTRTAILDGLRAAGRGEVAEVGPRGGRRWPVRYFARRSAWHTIAHAWEIERRLRPAEGSTK